jgi:YVTN family beta-propeller protein
MLRIDPHGNRVTDTVDVGSDPSAVAFGARHVWVSTVKDASVWRIDPRTFAAKPFAADPYPTGVAVSGGVVYLPERGGGAVTGLSAVNGKPRYAVSTPADYFGGPITSGGKGVWFVEEVNEAGKALRLDAGSSLFGKPAFSVSIRDPRPLDEAHVRFDFAGVAAGPDGIWVAGDALDRRVLEIDPMKRRVIAKVHLRFPPGGIAAGLGAVWVTDQLGDVVARLDPTTHKVVRNIHVGREPTGIAVGAGSVWVANTLDRSISRINPLSNRVVTIPLKVRPKAVTVADGVVWVAASAG